MASGMCEFKQTLEVLLSPAHRHLAEVHGVPSVRLSEPVYRLGPITSLGDRPWSDPQALDS